MVLNNIEGVAVLFYRILVCIFLFVCLFVWIFRVFVCLLGVFLVFLVFYFKVMSQANIITGEQVILNSSNVIIPVLSKSMYSKLQFFSRK